MAEVERMASQFGGMDPRTNVEAGETKGRGE